MKRLDRDAKAHLLALLLLKPTSSVNKCLALSLELLLEEILANDRDVEGSEILFTQARQSRPTHDGQSDQRTDSKTLRALSFSLMSSLMMEAKRASVSLASCEAWRASSPVTAMIRRIPLAIPDSSVMTKSLMSLVLATWLSRMRRERVSERIEAEERDADSRSTAELDTGLPPLGVGDIGHHLLDAVLESNHTNGIGVGLSKDSTKTRDLLSGLEVHLLGKDLDGLLDPLVRDALDLGEVVGRDGRLVREVEAELGGGDERSLLVDVVAEDFTEGKVEDVGSSVVVAKRPAAELRRAAGQLRRSKTKGTLRPTSS